MRVYPRTCGGTKIPSGVPVASPGLSPHVRGNPDPMADQIGLRGSIPARAGEPSATGARPCTRRVYPRTCGGTSCPSSPDSTPSGLSPHVRGNPPSFNASFTSRGSIPARAGEPGTSCRTSPFRGVYPRTCGGTNAHSLSLSISKGLSPHVRGNPSSTGPCGLHGGSIPARAGEPARSGTQGRKVRVYPRTCGGTASFLIGSGTGEGLSPHVRGNQLNRPVKGTRIGSIPARAGEPRHHAGQAWIQRVYPRTCGGTTSQNQRATRPTGLSPHVRGNPPFLRSRSFGQGSIPARAGEPFRTASQSTGTRVYPRTCGGTGSSWHRCALLPGLSPHVRGNPILWTETGRMEGSIPARAGEPPGSHTLSSYSKVYPRTCGGTPRITHIVQLFQGLSPHVRGNLVAPEEQNPPPGSIPARAGEPLLLSEGRQPRQVYPRTCGGTLYCDPPYVDREGLSPHVRGNLEKGQPETGRYGSIPARAGEP